MLPRDLPGTREYFAPVEQDPRVTAHLRRVAYEGNSPMAGRVHQIVGWEQWSYSRKMAFLRACTMDWAKDPALAVKAQKILREARVPQRDARASWEGLLKWVQSHITYQNEPGERICSPQHTLSTGGPSDCFPEDTPVLREGHELVPIKMLCVGDRIWGLDRWSTVVAFEHKGELPVTAVTLNNGSTISLTEDHHVYVKSCSVHGPTCPDIVGSANYCHKVGREFTEIRIRVSELTEGMEMPTPERLPFGSEAQDPQRAYVEGLFLSDGWVSYASYERVDGSRQPPQSFSIAGKDGCPKEAQKREVERICQEFGIRTTWHARYITVHDPEWAQRLSNFGKRAFEKFAPTVNLDEAAAAEVLRGIMADSGQNTHGGSRAFTTTSPLLALQTRVLWKMFGRTCGARTVVDHGGLGEHPVYRLNPRVRTEERGQGSEKRLRVKRIERNVAVVACVDIETDDHRVYLPAGDVTVSQCDDMAICLAALGESLRLPWKFVLTGKLRDGSRYRWVEGMPEPPEGFNASHIFLYVGGPPFRPTWWAWAEPTLDVKLGWDLFRDRIPGSRADMAGHSLEGLVVTGDAFALSAVVGGEKLLEKLRRHVAAVPWQNVAATVIGGVLSAIVLKRLLGKGSRKS